ncbi:MAG: tRNA (adenosine(37)-N6)-dimethylallyltransferase MiaA [Candidatus Moranbacteria bacterium]|nr:tRNA (adenosine(37)-N6)-dimethylallyltransferase MiaA [Candidatus Moranbacteria bacterium]
MKDKLNKVIVILGPTSAGKSAVAIELAKKFDGEVVSVDSRQIYRGMDVGTGKIPGTWNVERGTFLSEGIDHHMIDVVSPRTNFSVAQFKKKADKAIADILKRGKLPILCGGTGFWIDAVVDNIVYPEVAPNWELRKDLETKSTEELFTKLKKLDTRRAENIDAKNKVRLIRAIEICQAVGRVPDNRSTLHVPRYASLKIGINPGKEKLHAKIKKRLDQRWKDGMLEEVQKLHKVGLSWKKIQSFGLGYFWIPKYLREEITLEELYERVYLAEKDYAKRQMTWFQKDKKILWLTKYSDIQKAVTKFIK